MEEKMWTWMAVKVELGGWRWKWTEVVGGFDLI